MWRLDVGPLWHFEASGIPVVHAQAEAGARVPEWRPWPGEKVSLTLRRPSGVPGQTLTVDSSLLELQPGLRATDATLTLGLRSSRGTQHTVTLPEGAQLQSVSLNGATQPVRQEGRQVTLPLVPGAQQVVLSWRQPDAIRSLYSTPAVDVGAPTVNARTQLSVPRDRWVLFLGGPRLGPAVLFWSTLLVLLGVAMALGRVRTTPLRARHWVLLGLGLSQVHVVAAALVTGWLLFLGWRKEAGARSESVLSFNVRQLMLVGWTFAALISLVAAIHTGLLGTPQMQIRGCDSSPWMLKWFQDRTGAVLPTPWVLSVPLLVYRVLMLGWALWLASSILGWLKWGWSAFTAGGLWRHARKPLAPPAPNGQEP